MLKWIKIPFLKKADLHNPIHQLEGSAQAKVTLFMVYGDSDRIVPLEENTDIVINRYTKLGREAKVKVVPGKGDQGGRFLKIKGID